MALVFLEGVLTLSNVYEKVKTFKMMKKRKLRGIEDILFSLKRFFSYRDDPDKFLAQSSEKIFMLDWQNI